MSFSNSIREEIEKTIPAPRHCRIAELAALILFLAKPGSASEEILLTNDNKIVLERVTALSKKLFSEDFGEVGVKRFRTGKETYFLAIPVNMRDTMFKTLKLSSMKNETGNINAPNNAKNGIDNKSDRADNRKASEILKVSRMIYSQPCCKRAFLRGAFLACGSVTDPKKDYHLEFVTESELHGVLLAKLLEDFGIPAKIVARKNNFVVYIKDSESIVDILNIIEAHVALMELENVRIVKEVSNDVNRRTNCEIANIGKTVEAAERQVKDIEFLSERLGLEKLGEELETTARLRLENPEASLSELCKLHDTPIGRSGVNHRLAKITQYAERLRSGKPIN